MEVADVAVDFVPGFEGEWDDRYEAEREPFPSKYNSVSVWTLMSVESLGAPCPRKVYECSPSLYYLPAEVPAVLALTTDVFCAR